MDRSRQAQRGSRATACHETPRAPAGGSTAFISSGDTPPLSGLTTLPTAGLLARGSSQCASLPGVTASGMGRRTTHRSQLRGQLRIPCRARHRIPFSSPPPAWRTANRKSGELSRAVVALSNRRVLSGPHGGANCWEDYQSVAVGDRDDEAQEGGACRITPKQRLAMAA